MTAIEHAPYQLLPPLSADEYAELRASIIERGVLVPVVVDEDGIVLDGHHRQQIADELGIDYPVTQMSPVGDTAKRTLALSLNLDRRHLDRAAKRSLIEASLKADPDLPNRQHAERVGASHVTVGTVREELEGRGQIDHVSVRVDSVGRAQPAEREVVPRFKPGAVPPPLRATALKPPAPVLSVDEQRAVDIAEAQERYARALVKFVDSWHYFRSYHEGKWRDEIQAHLTAPDIETLNEIEEYLKR